MSRIIAIIDTYDVMTNDQIYKKAVSRQEALAEIERYAEANLIPCWQKFFLILILLLQVEVNKCAGISIEQIQPGLILADQFLGPKGSCC